MFSARTGSKVSAFDAAESLKSSCSSPSEHGSSSIGLSHTDKTSADLSRTTNSGVSAIDMAERFKSSCSSLSCGETFSANILSSIKTESSAFVFALSICLCKTYFLSHSRSRRESQMETDSTDIAFNLKSSRSSTVGYESQTSASSTVASDTDGFNSSAFDMAESLKSSTSSQSCDDGSLLETESSVFVFETSICLCSTYFLSLSRSEMLSWAETDSKNNASFTSSSLDFCTFSCSGRVCFATSTEDTLSSCWNDSLHISRTTRSSSSSLSCNTIIVLVSINCSPILQSASDNIVLSSTVCSDAHASVSVSLITVSSTITTPLSSSSPLSITIRSTITSSPMLRSASE
uniref:Uncharacterized protein n=1 Tax=Anopheles christyi TaxID=43041 RepID=A0A182KCU8_9DIPT